MVLLSPLGLRWLGTVHGFNWRRLANIGQAYDAVAALITALALGGVTAALFVQIREVRISQEQAARTLHIEMTRMAIENSDLYPILGTGKAGAQGARLHTYLNLWIAYWLSLYRLGYLNDLEVRICVTEQIFRYAAGRDMWKMNRQGYAAGATDRRTRQFWRIVDSEYLRSIAHETTGMQNRSIASFQLVSKIRSATSISLLAFAAIIALFGIRHRRRRSGRSRGQYS